MTSSTGVTVTITIRPIVAIVSGSKLKITVAGALTSDLPPFTSLITNVLSPAAASSMISSELVNPRLLQITFSVDIAADTIVTVSLGTFVHPSLSSGASDSLEAAIIDPNGNVVAPSSSGSYPATFSSVLSGSSVNVSSSVANAPAVTVTVKFIPSSQSVTILRLSGLGFVEFAGSSTNRRLLQSGITCSNLVYAGQGDLTASYNALDGELIITFPGGLASVVNLGLPCACQISGFRNPAAATASAGVMVTTYDQNFAGSGIQSSVIFPAILCAPGYLQTVTANSVNCAACPKGKYGNTPGASECLLCGSGTFNPVEAADSSSACIPCPNATFSNATGAIDASACMKCPPGTNNSKSGASTCTTCTIGTYAESSGQQYCDPCRAGTYGLQIGSSSKAHCSLCAAGTNSSAGSSVCMRCPSGTQSREGEATCTPCEKGDYSDFGLCQKCPGITYSLQVGTQSLYDCSGVRVFIGGKDVALYIGGTILILYILSFSFVPAWTATETVIRFQLTANFEGRLKKNAKRSAIKHRSTWFERISSKLSKSGGANVDGHDIIQKRFFEVGDTVMWEGHVADGAIGTVESTSVYPEQDPDEYGDYVVFIKMEQNFMTSLKMLNEAAGDKNGEKAVLIDSRDHSCRCQLLKEPQSHARMPVLGIRLGRWEIIRQISACFQLLILSFCPAVDTISDLVYILSSVFHNYYLFAASVVCITAQFWVFVTRLKKRRVFEAFMKRRVELTFLKGLPWWPKWASPDNLPVFVTLILPFYFIYHVVFPVIWFLVGYIIYSFQLFPISRISNRWLYLFVYSFAVEKESYRRRFDTSDAIILPMVQKGKVEETILESVPQLIIQLINTYLLQEFSNMDAVTLFSISLSVLSLSNTIWYYSYWNLFRCKPIRDVPSALSLYNYKLSGVKDGQYSFGKPSNDVNEIEMSANQMLSITIGDTVLNHKSRISGEDVDEMCGKLPQRIVAAENSEIEIVRPDEDDAGVGLAVDPDAMAPLAVDATVAPALHAGLVEDVLDSGSGSDADVVSDDNPPSVVILQDQLRAARRMIVKLEAEKRRMAEEVAKMKHELLHLSVLPQAPHAVVSVDSHTGSEGHIARRPSEESSFETVEYFLDINYPSLGLMFSQVWHAALKVQRVMRGHFGRSVFRSSCRELQNELLGGFEWVNNTDSSHFHDEQISTRATERHIISIQAAARGHIGRRLFRARCSEVTRELLVVGTCSSNSDVATAETTMPAEEHADGNQSSSNPELEQDDFIEAMFRLYQTRVRLVLHAMLPSSVFTHS